MIKEVKAVVLAAGKGTRMDSKIAKCLHKINEKPMINYIEDALHNVAEISENIYIISPDNKVDILRVLDSKAGYAIQENQLGTGHAVKMAKPNLEGFTGDVLITLGDCPLLTSETIETMIREHNRRNDVCTILTAHLDNPFGYGRIIKQKSRVIEIIEEKDADSSQKMVKEVNSGVFLVDSELLFEALEDIKNNNASQEFYITDIVAEFVKKGLNVGSFMTPNILEIQGINTKQQLSYVESIIQHQKHSR